MDVKPNVFPIGGASQKTDQQKITEFESEKKQVTNEVYTNSMNETQFDAVEEMRKRTEIQMAMRDEQLRKNSEQTANFQTLTDTATNRVSTPEKTNNMNDTNNGVYTPPPAVPPTPPVTPPSAPSMQGPQDFGKNPSNIDAKILELSQPQFNTPFDVIPLPSEGKLYPSKKGSVKVGYMTAGDENILTSPNLLKSGEFLEILINRKLLETNLRYRDLHVGDRNAIMLWLRATSYGEMYPVTMLDENDKAFETNINLNDLKTINLGAEPDGEGYFDFVLPLSKSKIKFRLLTVGDVDDIEKMISDDEKNEALVNNTSTYALERTIVEVDGNRDKNFVKEFANNLRIRDAKELRAYIDKIESGVDLEVTVGTPGGGSIKSFLPLNLQFFWPDL